jgi:hypothetical protein
MPRAPLPTLSNAQCRCLVLAAAHGPLRSHRGVWHAGDTIAAGEVTVRALMRKRLMVLSYACDRRKSAHLTPNGKRYAETIAAMDALRADGASTRD